MPKIPAPSSSKAKKQVKKPAKNDLPPLPLFKSRLRQAWNKGGSVGLYALGGLLLFQMVQLYSFNERIDFIDDLGANNTQVLQEMSITQDFLVNFAYDLNQIRSFLLLPTRDYSFEDADEVNLVSEEPSTGELVFSLVAELGAYEMNQERYEENRAALELLAGETLWSEAALTVDWNEEKFSVLDEANELFSLSLTPVGELSLLTYGQAEVELLDEEVNLLEWAMAFASEDLPELREQMAWVEVERLWLQEALQEATLQEFLKLEGLRFQDEMEQATAFSQTLVNQDGEPLLSLFISKEKERVWTLLVKPMEREKAKEFELNRDDFLTEFMELLQEDVETRSAHELAVDKALSDLSHLAKDPAFESVLNQYNLQLGEVLEDDFGFTMSILDAEGELLRTLYLNKSTGEVEVRDPSSGVNEDLLSAIQSIQEAAPGKKKVWTMLT